VDIGFIRQARPGRSLSLPRIGSAISKSLAAAVLASLSALSGAAADEGPRLIVTPHDGAAFDLSCRVTGQDGDPRTIERHSDRRETIELPAGTATCDVIQTRGEGRVVLVTHGPNDNRMHLSTSGAGSRQRITIR